MPTIKILLVDDDEDDYILTKDLISRGSGRDRYELSWCTQYKQALTSMLKNQHDIYLVDYRLGSHSGLDLLNEAVKSNCQKPIIILTGKGDLRIDEEAMRLGAADYLVKDEINSNTLERALRYAFEHHKTLQQLKGSENKFRIIFERCKDPMFISDVYGKIYDANPAAIHLFELTKEEFLRRNAIQLYKNKACRKIFTNSMEKTGSVNDLEFELVTATGKVKYCKISAFTQISEQGEELYYSILHDLTYRRLQEQEKVLEEKLSAIERISRSIADEIYNPLSNINLAVDELKSSNQQQEDEILLEIVKKNCEDITQLTAELIESTQLTALNIKKVDLLSIINSSVQTTVGSTDIEVNSPATSGPLWMYGDQCKLAVAFSNLIQNAAESLRHDKKQISIEVLNTPAEIAMKISDSGEGIAKENLNKIFEPFYSTKSKAPGLGLTHAQRIIQAHDGRLEVKSRLGEGTTVTINLPMIKS